MRITGTVATNGSGGTIAYQWLRPDGRPGGSGRMSLAEGQRRATVTATFDYDGAGPATGVAALHVVSPASVYSQPVRVAYLCPG